MGIRLNSYPFYLILAPFSPILSFQYLSRNCYPILPQFFPNSHSIIFHSQSISYPVFIPLFLNSLLFHSFSLHSYPILSHFIPIPFFLTSFLSHSFSLHVHAGCLCSPGEHVLLFGMIRKSQATVSTHRALVLSG